MTKSEYLLASIYKQYLDNELDECRPEWNIKWNISPEKGLENDLETVLLEGRGGKTLLTLQDCKNAWDHRFDKVGDYFFDEDILRVIATSDSTDPIPKRRGL